MCSTMLVHCGTFAIAPALAQQGGQVAGQGNRVSISIPAQSLNSAIDAFSRATGWQVGYSSAIDGNARTNAVSGVMSPRQALRAMLARTGINVRITGPRSAALVSPAGSDESVPDTGNPPVNGNLLDTIEVTAAGATGSGFRGTPDWVYETPASVSVVTREAIEETGVRDTRRLFDSVSGAYSGDGVGSFPTVSPNIRGLQDSARVIVSIDGARQNAQDGGRYGGATIGGIGMAFVDTSFVREVDIRKNTEAGANNAGSLGGATDFRLIGAQDIIEPGKTWGSEFNLSKGTNAYKFDGSAIGAMKLGESLALTFGASHKNMGEYEPGRQGDAEARYDLTEQKNHSTFLKLEAELEDVTASVAWLHQVNKFSYDVVADGNGSSFVAQTDTIVADLGWAPESSWVNLAGKVWANFSDIEETREPRTSTPTTVIDKDLTSFGFILENTSEIDTSFGSLNLNYGAEAFRDSAGKSARSSSIAENPLFVSSYGAFSPPGRRDVASAFFNGTLQPVEWINVSGGLRYDWYRLKGSSNYYNETVQTTTFTVRSVISYWDYVLPSLTPQQIASYPPPFIFLLQNRMGEVIDGEFFDAGQIIRNSTVTLHSNTDDIDRSDGAWLPSATIELKALDWLTPYASYSKSFRPPTITETFASGSWGPGDFVGKNLAANTRLRPEQAETYEIGANVVLDQLFSEQDRLRMKLAAFYRKVDDYIVLGTIIKDGEPDRTYTGFINLDGTARMRGIELEGNYDANFFWLGASTTLLDISWLQRTETFDNGIVSTDGKIFAWNTSVPPRFKITLDSGFRLFEQKMALGARMNYVTPTSNARLANNGDVVEYSESYTTLDLYGSYQINEQALLRVSANNVTDIRYIPATGIYLAPGRTLQASLKLRF